MSNMVEIPVYDIVSGRLTGDVVSVPQIAFEEIFQSLQGPTKFEPGRFGDMVDDACTRYGMRYFEATMLCYYARVLWGSAP